MLLSFLLWQQSLKIFLGVEAILLVASIECFSAVYQLATMWKRSWLGCVRSLMILYTISYWCLRCASGDPVIHWANSLPCGGLWGLIWTGCFTRLLRVLSAVALYKLWGCSIDMVGSLNLLRRWKHHCAEGFVDQLGSCKILVIRNLNLIILSVADLPVWRSNCFPQQLVLWFYQYSRTCCFVYSKENTAKLLCKAGCTIQDFSQKL